ncbi:MAG: DUF1127 domain-containing protein [Methylobacterium sp.]|uniref:DUF1127 domain-containing protein n=1 Tax=Methylobacterium sp. TaxID=409 RepID=UPI0025E651F0|nr:DUF1127 domain-containing protein [Methylobacterium sp.]MBX9934677.1 DUF1127 domain-containing protein [Methylobacterium sp.]
MQTTTCQTTVGRSREPVSLLERAARLISGVASRIGEELSRQAMNRRVLQQLSAMSERELRDIGLVRQDLFDASSLSGSGDASLLLVDRRNERRAGRRAP